MKTTLSLLTFLCLVLFISCVKEIPREGYVPVEGGRIYYKIVGEGDGVPIVVMHGGPGSRTCPMIPGLSRLAKDRQVIFYDQLGSGLSDRPTDTTLWQTERFVDEIDLLREALNLKEVHMLGHSCGSTFLIEYMVTKDPKGVRSVIFSSPHISTPVWMDDARILLSELPESIRDTITKYESLQMYTAQPYLAATDSFYARHLSRTGYPNVSIPPCDEQPGFNSEIYNYMWGPTEFNVTGTLKDFDRTPDLHKIEEPILFMTGEFDEARPESMYKFQKMCKDATVEIIEGAAHMTFIDQPEEVERAVTRFLNQVEKN